MSQGILTYYFRDKEEVVFEMVRTDNHLLADEIVAHLRAARNGWERLIALTDGNFPAARYDRPTARAWISLYAEAAHNKRYARLIRPCYRQLRSNIAAILKPVMMTEEIDQFVRGFAAMIDGLWLRRGHSETDMWLDEPKLLLIEYVEKMLGADVVATLKAG